MGKNCQFCVMDDSIAPLNFDENGRCNACHEASERIRYNYFPDQRGRRLTEQLVKRLKKEGLGKNYDCMIGLSGGIDSAFLAHYAVQDLGLRVLAVHVDGGWNSEPAVRNIESLVTKLFIDLHTVVIEWQEMRDLQVAFLRSGVINQDIPQDHAFFNSLQKAAADFGITSFLSGVNLQTECVEIPDGGHSSLDGRHVRAIHALYGTVPLTTFPTSTLFTYLFRSRISRTVATYKPLNWMNYNKKHAISLLQERYNWADYGTKHSESRFTKFYQDVYLPCKLGFDKRRLHLSSSIVSGEISREEAVEELKKPIISEREAKRDKKFVAKKLKMSPSDLEDLIEAPIVPHFKFKNDAWIQQLLLNAKSVKNRIFR